MDFKVRQHQELKHTKTLLVPINTETLWLSEVTEEINETSIKILSQLIVQEKNISKIPASFDKMFEQIVMNGIIEAKHYNLKQHLKIILMRSKMIMWKHHLLWHESFIHHLKQTFFVFWTYKHQSNAMDGPTMTWIIITIHRTFVFYAN